MIIEESDFKLTDTLGDLWDLELLQTIRPKGKPERQEFQIEGYGLTLTGCIKRIIKYRLAKKQETYSLKEYLDNYSKEIKQLKELLKEN